MSQTIHNYLRCPFFEEFIQPNCFRVNFISGAVLQYLILDVYFDIITPTANKHESILPGNDHISKSVKNLKRKMYFNIRAKVHSFGP